MADIKVAYYVDITDHVGYSLYSLSVLGDKVREYGNKVVSVERVITEWWGSHEDDTRNYRYLSRKDVTDEVRMAFKAS